MAEQENSSSDIQDDNKILEEAKARFKLAMDAERDSRILSTDDRKFRAGEQWPAEIRKLREAEGRPCLTINKMPQFEQQITNDQRQNRPSIKVHPVDDVADPETAKVFQGVIKHIEVSSGADTARDTAFENAVRGSYGYYRIVTEYASPESFEQEIKAKRIRDPDTVLLDPNHQEPDGSDAEYGFIFERMPKDEFIKAFGESKLSGAGAWELEQSNVPDWVEQDTVIVAEYFYKDYETKELALLSTGETVLKSELPNPLPEGVKIVKERKASIPTVRWCKLNGAEVLDKTDWLGQWIPILPVYGAEVVVDGKVIRESLIRHAKDPARMYNFWKSAETEAITLAPKAPYVAAAGQIEGFEGIWETANRSNHSYLPYNPKAVDGTLLPPPQRQSVEPAVQAITQASMLASDEVKATTGLYDGSLGARSNETSGRAILARNNQAQTSNFHFTDNLNRTIRHEARIYVDLIPKVYDTARVARIIGDDGEQKIVKVNDPTAPGPHGKPYMLGAGKYDVTVDTGPSYATKRQEAVESMVEVSKYVPAIPQVAGDLMVKAMDWPGAQEIADRIKKTLPPGLADDQKDKSKELPPQVQAQMQQMGQMIEQLTGKLHEAHDVMDQKRQELESRERIEFKKLEVQLEIERAKLDAKDSLALLSAEIDSLNQRQQLLNYASPIEDEGQEEQPMNQGPGAPEMGSDGMEMGMQPTGGQSPGTPMEGYSSDDPSNF